MKTLILCGGEGTRIRDVASDIPKPMVDVGGKPILWHIMKLYASQGQSDFVLCLGHLGDAIRKYFLNYPVMASDCTITLSRSPGVEFHSAMEEEGWRVTLAETGRGAMTGARIRKASAYARGGPFMATYGDGVADVDIGALLAFHKAHGKLATVTGVRPPGRFGEMAVNGDRVIEFNEKPQVTEGFINGGFFVFEPGFVERYLAPGDGLILEQEPLMGASRDGELMVYKHEGYWQPMDTYREWKMLNDLWEAGEAPWRVW